MKDFFLIASPRITDKSTDLNASGKYVFIVKPSATKNEVKKAIQDQYRVRAVSVNIVHIPAKARRYRGVRSTGARVKKAIVTLAAGEKIDLGQ